MIKAVFFDVDGTLVSHRTKSVCQSARAALAELRKKGIKCVICTGRHMLELKELPVCDMDFDAYITLVGQLTLDGEGNVIAAFPFSPEDVGRFIRLFEEKRFPIQLVEHRHIYMNYIDERVIKVQSDISTSPPPPGEYTGAEICQVVMYINAEEQAELAGLLEGCYVTRWHPGGLDVLPGGGGKPLGMEAYMKTLGIEQSETMAFGDGDNDIDMLRFAGLGIAMGNAEEATKAAADYVTADIDDDGLAKALRRFGLID